MTIDISQGNPKTTEVVFEGKTYRFLHSDDNDHIIASMRQTGAFYEQELLSALRPLLRPGDRVVDVGANIGTHAVFFAGVCGCDVLAFEPNPVAADLLRKNADLNGLQDRIHVHAVALGAEEGSGDIVMPAARHNLGMVAIRPAQGGAGTVRIEPLSSHVGPQAIRLLKIDTEGMDYAVLAGAQSIIARDRCAVAIEVSDRNEYVKVSDLLEKNGYMPAGSFNYTPTHVFVHDEGSDPRQALGRISRQASLDYIDHAALRDALHRSRRETSTQIDQLSERISHQGDGLAQTFSRLQAESGEAAVARMKDLLDERRESDRQETARMSSAVDDLQGKVAEVGTTVHEVRDRFVHADEALAAIRTDIRDIEGKFGPAISDLNGKVAEMGATVRTLSEQALDANGAFDDLRADIRSLDGRMEPLVHGLESKLDRAIHALEEKLEHGTRAALEKSERLEETLLRLATATERIEARIGAIDGAVADIGRTLAADVSACKDRIEAMLRFAALSAEADNLRDAAHTQSQAMLARDIEAVKRHVSGEIALPQPPRPVPAEQQPEAAAGSVWRVVRKNAGASRAVAVAPVAVQARAEPSDRDKPAPTGRTIIATETYKDGWDGRGWANGKATLEAGGIVRIAGGGDAGFVTRKFPFEKGGIVEVAIELADTSATPVASLLSDADEGIGHEVPLKAGLTTFRAFAPGRTRQVKLKIATRNAPAGASFTVRRLTVTRIDIDAHQKAVRERVGEPVLASMASIPSRRAMLGDTVNSLLGQCDRVRVFLNNYPDVPDFLRHPRVDVRRSQDWDDRGDAGKTFWLERDKEPGYRLIVDDDLIFPPDFADVMCAKVAAKEKKAIYATHGVLLKQPIQRYYDPQSRAVTFHFAEPLPEDRAIHIATTGCTCFHSNLVKMRWHDFMYCNSADIWTTIYAQNNNISVLTPSRPKNWIRENRLNKSTETIYHNSFKKTKTRFDSSLVQDAVLKHNWPLTVRVGDGRKYGLLLAVSDTEGLAARIGQFVTRFADAAEWVVMLAYDRKDAALEAAVAKVAIDRETHLIDTAAGSDILAQATALMARTGIGAALAIDADALAAAGAPVVADTPEPWRNGTLTKLKAEDGKAVAGLVVAGDAQAAADLLRHLEGLALSPSAGVTAFAENGRKRKAPRGGTAGKAATPTVNSIFERVKVLNLDRRPDRWKSVSRSLALAGIKAERFSAVDGNVPEVGAEYERYLQQPQVAVSAEIPTIDFQRDLYMGYASQMARVAYLEREGRKAIASRGAWGYLKSYETILEEALAEGTESLLVFDDDVRLHKDTKALFAEAMKELPDDWLILQLGTLQYNWSPPWQEWHSPMLYRTNGSAIGSHAVGMRFDVLPFLLDHVKRFDMPYDIGALSAATRAFPDKCFVIYPNLAIQSMEDTDIGTSDFQQEKKREEAAATYRWTLDDYR